MRNTEVLRVESQHLTADLTNQIYFEVREADKFDAMTRIIDIEPDFLRHRLLPHEDRRGRGGDASGGPGLFGRGAARRRVAGPAREDSPQVPRQGGQHPGGDRRGCAGYRRVEPLARDQLFAAARIRRATSTASAVRAAPATRVRPSPSFRAPNCAVSTG